MTSRPPASKLILFRASSISFAAWSKAEGRATFLVEHNIDLVRQVADQVCVLQGGRIIAAGDVQRVLEDETVIREYLGHVYNA